MTKTTCKLLAALLCLALLAGCTPVGGGVDAPGGPAHTDVPAPTGAPAPTDAPTPTDAPAGAVPNEDGEIGGRGSGSSEKGGIRFGGVGGMGMTDGVGFAAEAAPAARPAEAPVAPPTDDWDWGWDGGEGDIIWDPDIDIGMDHRGPDPAAGLLTAGSWDDNRDWSRFLDNAGQNWSRLQAAWGMDPTHRVEVLLTGDGGPIRGAEVTLLSGQEPYWQAVTDYEGRAFLFWGVAGMDGAPADHVTVRVEGREPEDFPLEPDQTLLEAELAPPAASLDRVDVMFMVDTTGSMWDELEYLQAELEDVMLRAGEVLPNAALRLSVNFYRDEGDEYVVRYFRFHEDISQSVESLRAQSASGGGDYPEAVDQALDNAVNGHAWEPDAVKLLFLVLDAPPHVDREGTPESIRASVTQAAAMGIRIIPVASSGVDEETEFVTRTAAVLTGGTYTFLTDHSGIGGSHKDPTNVDCEVEPLNELLLRLIVQYAGG